MTRTPLLLLVKVIGLVVLGCTASAQLKFKFPDEALSQHHFWKESVLVNEFKPSDASTGVALKTWTESVDVLGIKAHGIWGRFEGGDLKSITILFLDSGTHFGYVGKPGQLEEEMARRQNFRDQFNQTRKTLEKALKELSGQEAMRLSIGNSPMLSQAVQIFKVGDLYARYHEVESQLLKVTWFPTLKEAKSWRIPERGRNFSENVEKSKSGDVFIESVPILPQGDRAYCGVSALATVMLYLGLNAETEDLAAAAGIRFGTTRGSFVREVYDAAADEAGMRLKADREIKFDQLRASIDGGIPAIVWRRWNQQRDFLHSAFSKRFKKDPDQELPLPTDEDRATWPDQNSFNHASVITGYNLERGEVLFSESWSDAFRNRRMRIEELTGTSYYAFCFIPESD